MKKVFSLMFGLLVAMALSTQLHALTRIVSNFGNQTGGEVFTGTSPGAGGTLFYVRTFTTDPGTDTLFIELSGTADTHNGAGSQVNCTLDGINCKAGTHFASGFPGWFAWQRTCGPSNPCPGVPAGGFFDLHDNAVQSRWCVQVPGDVDLGGTHTLNLRLGVFPTGGNNAAFLEAWHVTVDEEATGGECTGS